MFCQRMNVTFHSGGRDVADSTGAYFGFAARTSVTFTFDNLTPRGQHSASMVPMVAAVSGGDGLRHRPDSHIVGVQV